MNILCSEGTSKVFMRLTSSSQTQERRDAKSIESTSTKPKQALTLLRSQVPAQQRQVPRRVPAPDHAESTANMENLTLMLLQKHLKHLIKAA